MRRISAALIVRDEEHTLGRCLDSVYTAVDEIIVVDTGSRDGTKAVARRYTDQILDYPWGKDFAAARQFAFDQATGDWVCWVDADDVVLHADRIRSLIADAAPGVGAFYWPYICDRDAHGNILCQFWRERCVRNDGTYRWKSPIHEVLVSDKPWERVYSAEVAVEHHRETARAAPHLRRNLEILEAATAAEGARDGRLHFYLGREYASAGETRKALKALRACLRFSTWDAERYMAQTHMAAVYRAEKRYGPAINADLRALKIWPQYPDAYFGLAQSYYFLKDWPRVLHWTEIGRTMPVPESLPIINPMDYRFNWIIYYTSALSRLGVLKEAYDWTQRALEICPDDPWHRHNALILQDHARYAVWKHAPEVQAALPDAPHAGIDR